MIVYAEVGKSLQQIGGDCPEGWVEMLHERPRPECVADENGHWIVPKETVLASIAKRRYEAEISGTSYEGVPIDTGRDSQGLILGALSEAKLDPEYILRWKVPSVPGGRVTLNAEQVIAVARKVRAHVQACFDREFELIDAVEEGTFEVDMLEEGWPV